MTDAQAGGETADDIKDELRSQLHWLAALFGQPSELLRRALPVLHWRRLRAWLRGVEKLAGDLVRALAAELVVSLAPPRPGPRQEIERVAPSTEYLDSALWTGIRVGFLRELRAEPARRSAAAGAGSEGLGGWGAPSEPPRMRAARSLALRLEAVIRVAENAPRYAQRLARRRMRPPPRRPAAPRRRASSASSTGPVRIRTLGPPHRPPAIGSG